MSDGRSSEEEPESKRPKVDKNADEQEEDEFKLRMIIKENHGKSITCIKFNTIMDECKNIVATIGENQLNIYDNAHKGEFLDLMLHYTNDSEGHSGTLTACEWLAAGDAAGDPTLPWQPLKGDAYVAVGGNDRRVQILSVRRLQVVRLLDVNGAVTALAAGKRPAELLSASADGVVRLWNVHAAEPSLRSWSVSAVSLAWHPDNSRFFTGSTSGELQCWSSDNSSATLLQSFRGSIGTRNVLLTQESLAVVNSETMFSKGSDGVVVRWKHVDGEWKNTKQWKVVQSSRGMAADEEYVAVGTNEGSVRIFNHSGELHTVVSHRRARSPVKSISWAVGGLSLLFATGPFLWRWDKKLVSQAAPSEPSPQ